MLHLPPLAMGVTAALVGAALAAPATAQWQPAGAPVCTAAGDQGRVAALAEATGGLFLAWEDRRAGSADIYVTRLTSAGNTAPGWPLDGLAVCTAPYDQLAPMLAPDAAGGVFVAWYDYRTTGHAAVQRVTSGGTMAPDWPADGWLVGPASFRVFAYEVEQPVALQPDGAGGAFIAWEGERNFYFQTLVQRVTATGTPAAGWPAGGLAAAPVDNDQIEPSMTTSGAALLLAWADYRNGEFDLYAQALMPDGSIAPSWPAAGIAICDADSDQVAPTMLADGAGGAMVVWMDFRNRPHSDLYALRVTGAGTPALGWSAGGLVVVTAWAHQRWPRLLTDGDYGAFLVWQDERSNADVYAAHLRGSGSVDPAWPLFGLPVCAEPDLQRLPVVAGDGAGGMVVVWQDNRPAAAVHAQRVTPAGAALWSPGGIPLSQSAASAARAPAISTAGEGGSFIAWADDRNGTFDIFAQRVGPDGVAVPVATPPVTIAVGLRLGPPRPNPARGQVSIELALPHAGIAEVIILDAAGRCVRTLARGERAAGAQRMAWDGRDDNGVPIRAGLYWVRLSWGGETLVRRLAWLSRR
jgi:flagellar hook capping protein FlgD